MHQQNLLLRRQSGLHPVKAKPFGHAFSNLLAVTRREQDTPDALLSEVREHHCNAFTQRISHNQMPCDSAVNSHGNDDGAG